MAVRVGACSTAAFDSRSSKASSLPSRSRRSACDIAWDPSSISPASALASSSSRVGPHRPAGASAACRRGRARHRTFPDAEPSEQRRHVGQPAAEAVVEREHGSSVARLPFLENLLGSEEPVAATLEVADLRLEAVERDQEACVVDFGRADSVVGEHRRRSPQSRGQDHSTDFDLQARASVERLGL